MANLSAPTIWEPLYECTSRVVVVGFVSGARIQIYVIQPASTENPRPLPEPVGGGVSFSFTGQVFGVDSSKMVAGAKIYARQQYDLGDRIIDSPPSTEIIIQRRPINIPRPRMPFPIHHCGKCTQMDGILPGSSIVVQDVTVSPGGEFPLTPSEGFPHMQTNMNVQVSPQFVQDNVILSYQIYRSIQGLSSASQRVNLLGIKKMNF